MSCLWIGVNLKRYFTVILLQIELDALCLYGVYCKLDTLLSFQINIFTVLHS